MKLSLFMVAIVIAVTECLTCVLPVFCQGSTSQTSGNNKEIRSPHQKDVPFQQNSVLVASAPDTAVKSVRDAFKKGGIEWGGFSSRKVMGIYVRKRDIARTKEILKADAQSHHYRIVFNDSREEPKL